MWQFILRIFGRSKVEPVVRKKSATVVDMTDTSLALKQFAEAVTKVPSNVQVLEIDHRAQERLRNRDIINSIAKEESMAPRRLVKTPASSSKSRETTSRTTTTTNDDTTTFIPITMHNTYHGSSYDNHSKACDTHTSPSYDSGSSDSGGNCSPSSD